jgi:hypothetical protein
VGGLLPHWQDPRSARTQRHASSSCLDMDRRLIYCGPRGYYPDCKLAVRPPSWRLLSFPTEGPGPRPEGATFPRCYRTWRGGPSPASISHPSSNRGKRAFYLPRCPPLLCIGVCVSTGEDDTGFPDVFCLVRALLFKLAEGTQVHTGGGPRVQCLISPSRQ